MLASLGPLCSWAGTKKVQVNQSIDRLSGYRQQGLLNYRQTAVRSQMVSSPVPVKDDHSPAVLHLGQGHLEAQSLHHCRH